MANKLDDIIRKVQGLMAKADHPNTPTPEADSCRAKAEALMYRYRIDEATAQAEEQGSIEPVWRAMPVCRIGNEFQSTYRFITGAVLTHLGIRGMYETVKNNDGDYIYVVNTVGFEADLRFADVLITSAIIAFRNKMEPTYDPSVSDQVNAYRMRSAGMEGRRIAMAIYGRDDRSLRPKVRRMFKKEAEARGEDPTILLGRDTNVKTFRRSYAEGFETEWYWRLHGMRQARGEAETGLVLAGQKERIDEAFYERYPNMRPAKAKAAIGDPRDGCAKCAKAKSGYCRDHQWLKPRVARQQRSHDHNAYSKGQAAARSVDLGKQGTGKLDGGSTTPKELG